MTYENVVRIQENYGNGENDYQWYSVDPLMVILIYDHNINFFYMFEATLTGIDERNDPKSASVYPNPSTGMISVMLPEESYQSQETVLMEIFDLTGRMVRVAEISFLLKHCYFFDNRI